VPGMSKFSGKRAPVPDRMLFQALDNEEDEIDNIVGDVPTSPDDW
jgi:hypothetical protein